MNHKKNSLNIFATLRDLLQGYYQHWVDLAQLAHLETQLALRTIVKISIVIYLLGFVLTTTWMTILIILFFYFISMKISLLAAASIILLLNIILIAALILYVLAVKQHIFFNATRRQLTHRKGN